MITVTEELLDEGRSINGSWNNRQLITIGVEKTYKNKGWRQKLIGQEITEDQKKLFLDLTNAHLKNKKKFRDKQITFETFNSLMKKTRKELSVTLLQKKTWQKSEILSVFDLACSIVTVKYVHCDEEDKIL